MLLTNDIYGLYQRMSAILASNDDVRYILVLDSQGNIKASTFAEGVPKGLAAANSVSAGQPSSVRTLSTSEGSMLDVAYPILQGQAGTIRVGLSKEPQESQVSRLTFTLLALTGGVLLAGLGVGYVLATVLTRPLAKLAEVARAVGQGDLSRQVAVKTRDETGKLAAAFNTMTEQLREKKEERSRLLDKIISAQEEERKRIARELHDEAGQALTSIALGLRHLSETSFQQEVQSMAANLRSLTAGTLDRIHDLALELRPAVLDDLGLVAALERYAHDYERKHGIRVDFHARNLDTKRLAPQEETALYRIAQEALTNVARHAQTLNVGLLLEERDESTVLIVVDDGQGFDAEALLHSGAYADRLGLLGMEERASLIGGRLTIESRPGAGTAVFVEVPAVGNDQWNGSGSS